MVHAERSIPPIENSREGQRRLCRKAKQEKIRYRLDVESKQKVSELELCMLPEEGCRRAD